MPEQTFAEELNSKWVTKYQDLPIPSQTEIELPLLKVISDSGGELRMKDAVRQVTALFPALTAEELDRKLPSDG